MKLFEESQENRFSFDHSCCTHSSVRNNLGLAEGSDLVTVFIKDKDDGRHPTARVFQDS